MTEIINIFKFYSSLTKTFFFFYCLMLVLPSHLTHCCLWWYFIFIHCHISDTMNNVFLLVSCQKFNWEKQTWRKKAFCQITIWEEKSCWAFLPSNYRIDEMTDLDVHSWIIVRWGTANLLFILLCVMLLVLKIFSSELLFLSNDFLRRFYLPLSLITHKLTSVKFSSYEIVTTKSKAKNFCANIYLKKICTATNCFFS